MPVNRPKFLAVQGLLVDVGKDVDAFETQLFHAPVDLGDGVLGVVPTQSDPSFEFSWVGLHHFGEVVVDA